MTIYEQKGHTDRKAYLESLAKAHGLSVEEVKAIADTLGPAEDFDALRTTLEDFRPTHHGIE